jgi:hypothetical protein
VQTEGDDVMRKIIGLVIALLMVTSSLALMPGLGSADSVQAGEKDVPAIFIANRFAPVGARWNGNTLVLDKTRNFDGVGTAWGTTQYPMPGPGSVMWIDPMNTSGNSEVLINVTPTRITDPFPTNDNDQRTSTPLYWTEFYLRVIPDKGNSQEYNNWFAVVDDMGQLWFDPDGRFHDSRYYAAADPDTEAYKYFGGTGNDNCKNNPHCKVDPSNANNTQGPYMFMPTTEDGYFNYTVTSDPQIADYDDPSNYPLFNTDPKKGGLAFMPNPHYTSREERVFRVGFCDMPDFPLAREGASTIPLGGISRPSIPAIGTNLVDSVVGSTEIITDTTVLPYATSEINDWDIGLPYVRFLDGWDEFNVVPPAPSTFGSYLDPPVINQDEYFIQDDDNGNNQAIFHYGEEWHSANVVVDPPPTSGAMANFTGNSIDIYDPGEWIYRAGANHMRDIPNNPGMLFGYDWASNQQTYDYAYWGCTRLTPVSMAYNGQFFNYAPGSIVRDLGGMSAAGGTFGTYDQGDDVDLLDPTSLMSPHNLFRFPLVDANFPGIPPSANIQHDSYETYHTDSVNYNPNIRCAAGAGIYDPYEGIYMKAATNGGEDTIQEGDYRLSNVNGNTYSQEAWLGWIGRDGGVFPAVGGNESRIFSVGGMWFGDVLVLSEILTGGCDSPEYNLSVQTDVWEGMIPSETSAAIRSPNDDLESAAQNVQKNTVLAPRGDEFQYPSTTFQDVKFKYREYLGLQVWHDDNKDCNLGLQETGPVPPGENLFMLNLSDDYRHGKTGEAHIGMKDGYAAKDVGRMLTQFWPANDDPSSVAYPVGDGWNGPMTDTEPGPRFYDTLNVGGFTQGGIFNLNKYGVGEAIYYDADADYDISAGDTRMTDITVQRGTGSFAEMVSYRKGSIVTAGDADVDMRLQAPDLSEFVPINDPATGTVIYWPAYYDERVEDVNNPGRFFEANGRFDSDEVIYDMSYSGRSFVEPGFQRLHDVTVGGVFYRAGSIVEEADLWVYQMPLYGISMGLNCKYQYTDMIIAPGSTGMDVEFEGPLQVESTTQIDVSFDPPPAGEYYDEWGEYHPEELAYVVIENVGSPGWNDIHEVYRVVSGRQPTARFQFTPYRGSCTNSGSKERVNIYDSDSNYRLKIRSYRDFGGVDKPAPLNRKFYDPWYDERDFDDVTMIDGRPFRQSESGVKIEGPQPMPPIPYALETGYDCFKENKYLIAPEKIDVDPSVACLQTLDQRFPNFSVSLIDADNEVDVNDPAGMRISVPLSTTDDIDPQFGREEYLIATYNGYGGGIEWIGTAIDNNGTAQRKYILQANQDGTYLYWYWLEPNPALSGIAGAVNPNIAPQLEGVLDSVDLLIGQDYTGTLSWRVVEGKYRPYVPADERVCRIPVMIDDKEEWKDTDCSEDFVQCSACSVEGMQAMGEVNGLHANWNAYYDTFNNATSYLRSDYYGAFDGTPPLNSFTNARAWIAGINPYHDPDGVLGNGDEYLWTGPWATGYGVQTLVTSYGQTEEEDPGGDALIAILPRDGRDHLKLQVYTVNGIYDYNSTIPHPEDGTSPYFVLDPLKNEGIDYCGVADIKVYQPDPYVNFAEWQIVDHALQYSTVDYTAGSGALSDLSVPTPQIQSPYNPILKTSKGGFRCYPGGQTHTGRVEGGTFGDGGAFGWNAYPAIWNNKFYKLGTEFFPLTDYGIFFILKDGEGRHLSFDPCWPVDQRLKRIEIVGPFARPRIWDIDKNSVLPKYKAWGLENVPIQYDWSGEIVIDSTNWTDFEYRGVDSSGNGLSLDFTNRSHFGDVTMPPPNAWLVYNNRLDYTMVGECSKPGSVDNLFVIDEIIPWNYGKILIYVTLWDGTFKMYQDCCVSPPVDGIDVQALEMSLEIEEDPERDKAFIQTNSEGDLTMPQQTFNVSLHEYHPLEKGMSPPPEWFDAEGEEISECNDAFMYVWQDRGTMKRGTGTMLFGAGDGWTSLAPTSSNLTFHPEQFEEPDDINEDGKIRFNDWETEIVGTYDMATNTWTGGIIDGRTFQRNDGLYTLVLSEDSGYVDTVGLDFGGEVTVDKQDHLIARNEVLPLYVTAYKYGDDNVDRAFTPMWDFDPQAQGQNDRYSHEVYLAAQMALPIEPECDLTVTVTPEKLTAGVTPELVDVTKPLTFNITKDSEPYNLLEGIPDDWGEVEVKEKDAWNHLFYDPHPDNEYFYGHGATLPQYYWVRTDLHNDDGSDICNAELYGLRNSADGNVVVPFDPIEVDFSGAANGAYVFKGFCANDNNQYMEDYPNYDQKTMNPNTENLKDEWKERHSLYVRIYTPDRRHAGCVDLDVFSPNVEYKITNMDDPNRVAYDSPGSPDFIMTAADNRIYKIKVTARDAMGALLKGVTKGVSVCGGGVKNTARFVPFSTRPQSFDFAFEQCMAPPCCTPVELHVGFDVVPDEKIRRTDRELYLLSGFSLNKSTSTETCSGSAASVSMGSVRYNTTNKWYWGDNEWDVTIEDGDEVMPWVAWDLPPPVEGWGVGSIYNHCWYGGFLFADYNEDGALSYLDELGLDVNAQTEFYIWAEDICYIGGLVGDNEYCNTPAFADVAGFPPFNDRTDPRYTEKRFRNKYTNDETFYLDWEAPPDNVALIDSPRIEILRASDRQPLSKDMVNPDNYDLTYAVQNHIIAVVRPADERDVGMSEDSRVYMSGNQNETRIFGHTKRSPEDSKAVETTIEFEPTGLGEAAAEITFMTPNKWYLKDPYQFVVPEWYSIRNHGMRNRAGTPRPADEWNPWLFDVGKGLTIQLIKEGKIYPQSKGTVIAIVKEAGTQMPMPDATVVFTGAGVDVEMNTNSDGEAKAEITPQEMGFIKATATLDGYLNSPAATIAVSRDITPPTLTIDTAGIESPTNDNKQTLTGTAEPGSTVMVNGKKATVDADGNWSIEVELTEGNNTFSVIVKDAAGNTTQQSVTIVLDTTPPDILVEPFEPVVDGDTYEIVGRVDPGSTVLVNGEEAEVVNDYFTATIMLKDAPSFTPVNIEATDAAGNTTELDPMQIENIKQNVVLLQQDNPNWTVNGEEMTLNVPPQNIGGSMMLPFRAIAEDAFGAGVEWIAETRTVVMTLGNIEVRLVIGSMTAVVNGEDVALTAPATVVNGSTLVPLRFVGETFGAEVTYHGEDRTVDIKWQTRP